MASNGSGPDSERIVHSDELIDLDRLRRPTDYGAMLGVKVTQAITIRKPGRVIFFRTHPEYQFPCDLLEEPRELVEGARGGFYAVDDSIAELVQGHVRRAQLVLAVDNRGNAFLWPLYLSDANGRTNDWYLTALEKADLARTQWIQLRPNQAQSVYEHATPLSDLGEPQWPEESFDDLLRRALKGRVIADAEHPIIRALRGAL